MIYPLTADIDECKVTCFESEKQICSNTIGSYMCECKDGYQKNNLKAAGQVCEGWCSDIYINELS